MRHSPENADGEPDPQLLDERFRELVVQLVPQVRRPPVETVHRAVRRRRVRNRIVASAASLVVIAGGATLVHGAVSEDSGPGRREAAATPVLSSSATASDPAPQTPPASTLPPFPDAMYPAASEFPVVTGAYENWHVADTRAAFGDTLGPCTTQTISGLDAVAAQERLYLHDGQGGGLVVLVRYPDERTAELASADFTKGFAGPCSTNPPNPDASGRTNITDLAVNGAAWRTQGVVNGQTQYVDYGIARDGAVVGVVTRTVIGPEKTPAASTIRPLLDALEFRLAGGVLPTRSVG